MYSLLAPLLLVVASSCIGQTAVEKVVNIANTSTGGDIGFQSRLSQFVSVAVYARFQLESEQPALVQAAANLVIDFRSRGNTASCISAVGDHRNQRDHMDVLNSFARRLNPIIALRMVDVVQIEKETFKSQLMIFVVDGLDGFR